MVPTRLLPLYCLKAPKLTSALQGILFFQTQHEPQLVWRNYHQFPHPSLQLHGTIVCWLSIAPHLQSVLVWLLLLGTVLDLMVTCPTEETMSTWTSLSLLFTVLTTILLLSVFLSSKLCHLRSQAIYLRFQPLHDIKKLPFWTVYSCHFRRFLILLFIS